MVSRRQVLGGGLAVAAAPLLGASPLLAACSGGSGEPAALSGPVRRVRYLTSFGDTIREAFALVANKTGIAAEYGVEFDVQIGRGGAYNHGQLAAGSVELIAADSSGAFTRYANGTDTSFQVVAAIHNKWPMALLGYADNGIRTPRDLNGRVIGIGEGTIAQRMWPAYARLTPGVDPDSVEVVPTDPATQVGQLISGQLDAIALFSVSAPGLSAAAGGREVTALPWADAFPDMYGNALVANTTLIEEDPDLVRDAARALLDGLAWMLDHPDQAAQMWVEEVPEGDATSSAEEARQMADFCYGQLTDEPLGYLDRTRVVQQLALLASVGEITSDFNRALPDSDGNGGVINLNLLDWGGGQS